MLEYNPIVKMGLFEITDGINTKRYRAVDPAQAIWKFCQRFNDGRFEPTKCEINIIEKPIREKDKNIRILGFKKIVKKG